MSFALNEQQTKAVTHKDSALLVTAGPGSGKTRVIVERVEFLIKKGISSENILCLTFTHKATGEMKDRLEKKGIVDATVSTYHSFCRDLCAEHAEITGLGKGTKIIPKTVRVNRVGIQFKGFLFFSSSKHFTHKKPAQIVSPLDRSLLHFLQFSSNLSPFQLRKS